MRFYALVPALASLVLAAPAPPAPELNVQAAAPSGLEYLSDYFNLLAKKVESARFMSVAPSCDLKLAKLPIASPPLPDPATGTKLKQVAIGRGTQNYTCDTSNSTAPPVAVGAVATLFDASCVAATYPDLLTMLPRVSMQFSLSAADPNRDIFLQRLGPSSLAVSGTHFFTADKVPFFSLDTAQKQAGHVGVGKNASSPAPPGAAAGPKGEPAVPWLRLLAKEGQATQNLLEVFRVETAGGSAPATCKDMPGSFQVEYAAQYWFFEGPEKKE